MALTTVRLLAQQFRLTANQTGSGSVGTVLTAWEEVDTSYEKIGNVWSQSSGTFSCANTGIYLCSWALVCNGNSGGDRYDPSIQISTDSGSNYSTRSLAWGMSENTSPIDLTTGNQFIFDVTNTTTFRLQYVESTSNNVSSNTTISGNSNYTTTNILFVRLGDT